MARWAEERTARFTAAALKAFPGSRELAESGYCACRRLGRLSPSLSEVLCDGCWRPRFYGGDPEVARRARERRG